MSEKLSIQEAGKSRNFNGVGVIETETPEGDSCFWVPASERELETEYVIKNGTYRPQKYGFSDIHVNVFDLITDLDGNDWKIDIGDIDVPDVPMPDISLTDFDIDLSLDIDDIGDTPSIDLTIGIHIITIDDDVIKVVLPGGEEIIIHGPSIPDKDPDDWPGWGDLDPDIKGDFDDWWEDDKDPDDWPGWEDLDPDIKGDFDDWWKDGKDPVVILDAIEISYDPSTGEWTIKALVECTVGDTTYNPGDVIKTWPGTEKVDFVIQAGIALPDLSETIDLDAGFDVSLDVDDASSLDDIGIDISGSDLDGLPIDVNINLGTLDIETTDLPDEIRIMHVPDKTSYKDGEAIDLEGIVVQAYRGGEVWDDPDGKYIDGYIPVHELTISPLIAKYDAEHSYSEKDGMQFYDKLTIEGEYYWGPTAMSVKYPLNLEIDPNDLMCVYYCGDDIRSYGWKYAYYIVWLYGTQQNLATYKNRGRETVITGKKYGPSSDPHFQNPFYATRYESTSTQYYLGTKGYESELFMAYSPEIKSFTPPSNPLRIAYDALYDGEELKRKCNQTIEVSWPRSHDSQLLTASFDIAVEENDGAAHSNTESSGGLGGGTTISGNYGGSHHSGKF